MAFVLLANGANAAVYMFAVMGTGVVQSTQLLAPQLERKNARTIERPWMVPERMSEDGSG